VSECRYGHTSGGKKNSRPCRESNPGRPADNPVTMLSELSVLFY